MSDDFIYLLDYPRVHWGGELEVPKVPDWFRPTRGCKGGCAKKPEHPWRASYPRKKKKESA